MPKQIQYEARIREWQRVFKRNATDTELAQARIVRPGNTFQVDRDTYRVVEVYRDELKRLIEVGVLED